MSTYKRATVSFFSGPMDTITAGESAVGASSRVSSLAGTSKGTRYWRQGIMSTIMIGKPIAAMVCDIAMVSPKKSHCIPTKKANVVRLTCKRLDGANAL